MKNESILYGVIGLLAGMLIIGFTATFAVNNNHSGMMRMMGMNTHSDNDGMMDDDDMSMSEMTTMLENKSGDEFDQSFIEQMIIHHEGAIEMAKIAQQKAKHQELKSLADDVVSAQSREIDMMQTWQSEWDYKDVPMSHQMR